MALLVGYVSVLRRPPRQSLIQWSPARLLAISVVVTLALVLPTLRYRTAGTFDLIESIRNPGQAYRSALGAATQAPEHRLVEYVRIAAGPILYLLLPFSVVYWRDLRPLLRVGAVAAILGDLTLWVGTGRNKGLADFFLILPWMYLVGRQAVSWAEWRSAIRRTMLLFGLSGIAFSMIFISFISARGPNKVFSTYDNDANIEASPPLAGNRGEYANEIMLGLATYITQGYYGLSLGLNEPFVPSYGLGNSMFLTAIAEKVTGNSELHTRSYPARIEERGWPMLRKYHTFYLWLASDLTFAGVIVVVFLLGRVLASCWIDVVERRNPFAIALFYNLLIVFYYIPANNQIMQFGEHVTSFWVTLALWFFSTRRERTGTA